LHGVNITSSKLWEYSDSFKKNTSTWYALRGTAINGVEVDISTLHYEFGNCLVGVYAYANYYYSRMRTPLLKRLEGAPVQLKGTVMPYGLAKALFSMVVYQLTYELEKEMFAEGKAHTHANVISLVNMGFTRSKTEHDLKREQLKEERRAKNQN